MSKLILFCCLFGYSQLVVGKPQCIQKKRDAFVQTLTQFKKMKTYHLNNPLLAQLFKLSMKYSLIHAHELWGKYTKKHDSIPGNILANGCIEIAEKLKNYTFSLEDFTNEIERDYRQFFKDGFPVIMPKGEFSQAAFASMSAKYIFYGLLRFNKIKKQLVQDSRYIKSPCAQSFYLAGVDPLFMYRKKSGASCLESIEHKMMAKLFLQENS